MVIYMYLEPNLVLKTKRPNRLIVFFLRKKDTSILMVLYTYIEGCQKTLVHTGLIIYAFFIAGGPTKPSRFPL